MPSAERSTISLLHRCVGGRSLRLFMNPMWTHMQQHARAAVPGFKTKNREAPITTQTEEVWLQPQDAITPLYLYIACCIACCYINVLNVVFITI